MSKPMWALLIALILAGLAVAYRFGNLGLDQLIYVGNLIGGWALWVIAVAILYAGLEKLFPNLLCAPPSDESPAPPSDKP
jgi:hypothetical protein